MRYTELISKKEETKKEHKIMKDWKYEAPYQSGIVMEVINIGDKYSFSKDKRVA